MTPAQLKARMTALGMSQGKIAEALGVSRETVVRWSTGKLPMPVWLPYALGLASLGTTPVAAAAKPADAPKPIPAHVVAKPSSKPVQPAKPKAPEPTVKGVYRFNRFYPDE